MKSPMTRKEWDEGLAFLEALDTSHVVRYMLANLDERVNKLEARQQPRAGDVFSFKTVHYSD